MLHVMPWCVIGGLWAVILIADSDLFLYWILTSIKGIVNDNKHNIK